jgi:hypothetical protein
MGYFCKRLISRFSIIKSFEMKNTLCSSMVLFICFFISCKTEVNQSESIVLSDVSGQIKIDEVFENFEYIPLETSDESIFGRINKLILYNHQFFILDNAKMKKVFVFNDDGSYSHTIGIVGKGPGEYTHIEDFAIDEENQ